MAAALAATPLALISMSMITGCGGGGGKVCFPNLCGCNSFFGLGLLAIWLLRGEDGVGRVGPSCWDVNVNGTCDWRPKTLTRDGVCDALDCQGPSGPDGQPIPGIDGLQCWDLNGNGTGDTDEDINGDGLFNALDCRGPAGPPGSDGSDGQDGQNGDPGPAGPPADQLWDWFVEDFFTYGEISDDISGQGEVIQLKEPTPGLQC